MSRTVPACMDDCKQLANLGLWERPRPSSGAGTQARSAQSCVHPQSKQPQELHNYSSVVLVSYKRFGSSPPFGASCTNHWPFVDCCASKYASYA
eukprot:4283296-Lingulodinium_polyedra.AAC.1